MAAYGGRAEIMDMVSPVGPVYQAGTLSGNPIATTAGITTLEILKQHPEYYTEIEKKAKRLAEAFAKRAELKKEAICVNQTGSLLCAFFTVGPVRDYDSATASDTKAYADYFGRMLEQGGRSTEKDLFGASGAYAAVLSKKTVGKPCPYCGNIIQKANYLGGTVYFCPECQGQASTR